MNIAPSRWSLLSACVVGLALWQGGCQSPATQSEDNTPANTSQAQSSADADSSGATSAKGKGKGKSQSQNQTRVTPPQNLPTPPGVDRSRLLARQGESLERARQSLEQILASLPESARSVLPPQDAAVAQADAVDVDSDDDDTQTREMPRAAQLAYIAGRLALNENNMQSAILQLKIALGLAPNEPDIARLLAMAYLRIGNRPAASMYLQQALRSDPTDIDSLIKLGRSSLERGDWEEAAVLFSRSLELSKQTDPSSAALEQICEFYLGSALEVGGYDKASSQQYLASMDGRTALTDKTAARYQMMMLSRQFGVVWQAVGDARLRLGEPAQAIEAYNQAVDIGVPSLDDWMSRYVYIQLLLGQPNQATKRTVEYLRTHKQQSSTLPLVKYLIEHGGDSRPLSEALQQIYADSDKSSAMAQMISNMLPDDQALSFLQAHLKERPADMDVAGELITRTMNTPKVTVSSAVNAMRLAALLIEQTPSQATPYAQAFLDALAASDTTSTNPANPAAGAKNDKPALADVVAKLEATKPVAGDSPGNVTAQSSSVRFIVAADYLQKSQLRQARPILESITQDDPSFMPARLLLAGQLVARTRWDEAAKLIDGIKDEPWRAQADNLRVRILAGQGETSKALTLLDEMISRQSDSVDLSLFKAGLQVQSGQVVLGERTLLDLLNVHPRDERIYKALFVLYDRGDVPDVNTQYQRLMIRLFETIPQSRIAYLQQVEMLVVRREHAQAEKLLRDLLARDEKDFEAMGTLARLLHETERGAEADKLVEEKLKEMGDDPQMLQFAAQYYQAFKNKEKSFEVRERLARQIEDPSQQAMNLAVLYMQQDRLDEAVEQAQKAVAGEPEDPQAVMSVLLHVMASKVKVAAEADRKPVIDAVNKEVADAIKRFPKHEADIRYELASFHARIGDEKASLDEMERVVKKFPDHAPSNNGLGYSWADDGIHLEKALLMIQVAVDAEPQNAAYLDSLGWVYYKLGRFDDAVLWLSQAATGKGSPSPVILDHLGDAFYRTGNIPKAIQIWQQAQRLLEVADFSDDPESAGLPGLLSKKITAAQRRADAPVAPTGPDIKTPDDKPAAALPATP